MTLDQAIASPPMAAPPGATYQTVRGERVVITLVCPRGTAVLFDLLAEEFDALDAAKTGPLELDWLALYRSRPELWPTAPPPQPAPTVHLRALPSRMRLMYA